MNSGDTTWVLVSTGLVLLMTPGLGFFYGGLVREGHAINTIKMSFVALGVVALLWATVGYTLAFAPGSGAFGGMLDGWIGGFDHLGLAGVGAAPSATVATSIPHVSFMAFQMAFAIITPALISGAVVGRMKFKAYLLFLASWSVLVYAPLAHMVWGPGGWLVELGALDFAGGTVVHVSAGVSALVAARILGPRHSDAGQRRHDAPHSVPLVVLGASLLWFGWIGFNGGSALAADGVAAMAVATTILAGSAAMLGWLTLDLLVKGKPSAVGAAIGAVVGLVAITPAAGFVSLGASMVIGVAAAPVSYFAVECLRRSRLDDTLDVFACHGVGGIVGALLTAVFASTAINPRGGDGLLAGSTALLAPQVVAVLAAGGFAAAGTACILTVLRATIGIRVGEHAELDGLDLVEHAETAYSRERATSPASFGGAA